jgi:hypothetical protein
MYLAKGKQKPLSMQRILITEVLLKIIPITVSVVGKDK